MGVLLPEDFLSEVLIVGDQDPGLGTGFRDDIRVPHAAKGDILRALCARLGIGKEHVAAVGDAEADIAMFREARISVAVNPSDPTVSEAATHTLDAGDLGPLLDLL